MRRVLSGLSMVLLAIAVCAAGATGAAADKKKKQKKAAEAPASAEIAKSLADVKWGMGKDEVEKVFIEKIKAKYKPLIAKTKDAVEEDRLRQVAKQELSRIREGYVEFDGKSTGWDVSFLKGEFSQKNDEAMLVVRDENSQNFYFFIGGKLWKWYKAFDASVFPANNFGSFAGAVQRRFGDAKEAKGELRKGAGERQWLEWQDKETRLRAVDETDFYGFYCLVFESKDTLGNLAKLRTVDDDKGDGKHALVEAVTTDDTTAEDSDDSSNIVDRLTGKIRQREDAPAPSEETASTKGSKKGKKAPVAAEPVIADEDDPLSGL
jgi:hypothetical protein